jgi:acyl-CoA dehydrogenase
MRWPSIIDTVAGMWDFTTEPEFQKKLDWMDEFIRTEIEPLDEVLDVNVFESPTGALRNLINSLKQEVRDQDLWACHLEPELGGQGYGQLKLALMNELLGRSMWAPIIFGCAAPDTGNAEIIAAYGTPEQKQKWLQPLLDGEVFSCYSMTEPHGGSDPTQFKCRAERDGDEWVINGDKFFSSNLRTASFIIVMAVTNPDVHPYQGMSMFLVPSDTPGIRVLQDIGHLGQRFGAGMHAHVRYENVRVPNDNLLGGEGKAFEVAQRRLGGGRIHHAMRTVATCQRYFEMMCERALSRTTKGGLLADKQMVQEQIADSWIELQEFRLLVLYTAWLIDNSSAREVRQYVAACKVRASQVMSKLGSRATHLHGALGVSNLMPLGGNGEIMATVDGPTEVHQVTIARQVMKQHRPAPDNWPTRFRPRVLMESRKRFDDIVARRVEPGDRAELDALVQQGQANDDAVARFEEYITLTADV